MGAMATLAGCAGLHGAETGKFAMNASTLRGYNLSLLDQMKAMALSGFRGYEPWMKDIRAAKADGTLGDVCRIARDSGVSFINGIAFGQWVNPDPKIRAAGLSLGGGGRNGKLCRSVCSVEGHRRHQRLS